MFSKFKIGMVSRSKSFGMEIRISRFEISSRDTLNQVFIQADLSKHCRRKSDATGRTLLLFFFFKYNRPWPSCSKRR